MVPRLKLRYPAVRALAIAGLAVSTLGFVISATPAGAKVATPGRFSTAPRAVFGGGGSGSPGSVNLVGRNVNITNENGPQSEVSIAVDPTNPLHQLATVNDLAAPSGATAGNWESFDRGKTWAPAGNNVGTGFCYDTWAAFNNAGDAFMSYECSDQRIGYKKAGTTTWVDTKLTNAGSFPDRDMVTVDNSTTSPFDGSVYIGYDDNGNNNAAHLMISRDGFGSWTQSPKINDTSSTIGVNAVTAPDGTVYALWEDYSGKKIWADKSTDGGTTWGTDHVVTNFRINTASFFIFIPPQNVRGVLPMPMTAVAPAGTPNAGRLYVTYFDKSPTGANTNIYTRFSDDGGTTWSAEKQVNDDTVNAYHFHANMSVSPNGTLAIAFYDTRNDQPANKKADVYVSFSTDGGVTWSANQRVSSASSDETVAAANLNQYGEYLGIYASSTNFFQIDWTDSRTGTKNEDMVTASVKP